MRRGGTGCLPLMTFCNNAIAIVLSVCFGFVCKGNPAGGWPTGFPKMPVCCCQIVSKMRSASYPVGHSFLQRHSLRSDIAIWLVAADWSSSPSVSFHTPQR